MHGKLYLTDKSNIKSPHLPINTFLESLAINSGKKAITVILSGLESDGTIGATAIKKAGGMVIARNPETSLFSSMPKSIIAAGMADFILEPGLMPALIEDYIENDGEILSSGVNDEKHINTIISLIKQR